MKRQGRFFIAMAVCWLGLTNVVLAKFDPYVEDPEHDWGDVTNPVPVWSNIAQVGHFGRLDPVGDVDAFAVEFAQPTAKWPLRVSVPVCASYFESVDLQIALIGPGLERPALTMLPFDLPDDMGAQLYSTRDKGSERYRSTDVMGIPTYAAPTFSVDIPESGTYMMAVWNANGDISPYILVTGTSNDQFAKRSDAELDAAFTQVFNGEWMHQDCQPPTPTSLPVTPTSQISSGIARVYHWLFAN